MAVQCRKGRPAPLFANARNSVTGHWRGKTDTEPNTYFWRITICQKSFVANLQKNWLVQFCSTPTPPCGSLLLTCPSRRKKECLAHPWYIQWQTKSCPKQSQENPHSWNYKNFPTLAFNPDVAWRDHITHFFELQNVKCGRKGQYFPQLGWPRLVT